MLYMNEYEIETAVKLLANDPTGKMARFLRDFKDEVNAHSDGWAYWRAPLRAARQLMMLVNSAVSAKRPNRDTVFIDISEKGFTKALAPIKSFYTRRGYAAGMKFPEVQ
jgi:hypothetical protein